MMASKMRALECGAGLAFAAFLATGCSGILGFDDKTFDGSGGTTTSTSTGATGGGGTGTGGTGGKSTGGTGGGGAGGGGTGGTSGNGGATATLDDEFDFDPAGAPDDALKARGWRFTRQEEPYPAAAPFPGVFVESGLLQVALADTFYWFSGNKGFLMYKELTGDFLVVADVAAKKLDIKAGIPEDMQSGAGILARDPAGAAFSTDYQHWLAVDRGGNDGVLHVHGTWVGPLGSASQPANTAQQQGKVAMCRVGDQFTIWSKEEGTWQPRTSLLKPDLVDVLPATLQVGVFAYAGGSSPQDPTPAGVLGEIDFVHQYAPAGSCDPGDHGE